jgi:hypothetical protein
MIARLVLGFVFVSSLLITRPVVAQSPYFEQYIDHAKFIKLSPRDQRDFLVALMQTVADLEQKAILSGRHLAPAEAKKTVHQQRWEQVKKALVRLQQLVVVSAAHADPVRPYRETCHESTQRSAQPVMKDNDAFSRTPETCLFGSYRSTYVTSNGQTYCQRPSCSIDETVRSEYDKFAQQGGCTKNQMACNPALFGRGVDTKPTCVDIDIKTGPNSEVNNVQNASLACLIAVTNDPNKVNRLTNIANSIKNDRDIAIEFNMLLHTISNLCICDGEVGNDAGVPDYLKDMSNSYSEYVKDHRTCNALLSQTSLVLKNLSAPGGGRCAAELLPQNLSGLSTDLEYIDNFSTRFHKLASGSDDSSRPLTEQEIKLAMVRYRARWVDATTEPGVGVTTVRGDVALDNVQEYKTHADTLKTSGRWCPLAFPDPESLVDYQCQITGATARRGEDRKVTVTATARITGLAEGVVVDSGLVWKVNSAVVDGQVGPTLSLPGLEIEAEATGVPVEATYSPRAGESISCPAVNASFEQPEQEQSCELSLSSVTKVEGQDNYNVTANIPDMVTGTFRTVTWTPAQEGTADALAKTRVLIVPKPADNAKILVSATVVTSVKTYECRGEADVPVVTSTATGADEPCTIVPSVVLGTDGKYSVSLSLEGATDQKAPEGEPTYTGFDFRTSGGVGTAVVTPENAAINKTVSASYKDKDGKQHSCSVTAVIPARAPQASTDSGFAPQQSGPMVRPPAGQSLFKPGLR